jgi:phage tail-like protein
MMPAPSTKPVSVRAAAGAAGLRPGWIERHLVLLPPLAAGAGICMAHFAPGRMRSIVDVRLGAISLPIAVLSWAVVIPAMMQAGPPSKDRPAVQVIEYRHGDSPSFHPIRMPGLCKVSNVKMHKGIFVNDSGLRNWLNQIAMNTITRQTVVVSLLDETGSPRMVWTLNNAWPTKITGADLKSDGSEVTIESIDVACETLVTSAP